MVEPKEKHARRVCDRPFFRVWFVLALGMAVNVRDRRYSWVAQGRVSLGGLSVGPLTVRKSTLRQAQRDKKKADTVDFVTLSLSKGGTREFVGRMLRALGARTPNHRSV